jgi:hypothetical protein
MLLRLLLSSWYAAPSYAASLAAPSYVAPWYAAAIGAIAYTFKLTKEQDENVKTVSLWLASVRDWLLLVATKVSSSNAASTFPLFEHLQSCLVAMAEQMASRNRKWRVSKMVTSGTFQRDFGNAKARVLELKDALHGFLDQEQQDKQTAMLDALSASTVETTSKLAGLDDQLSSIKAMLEKQAEEKAAKEKSTAQVQEQEEQIFASIAQAAGVEGDVPCKRFVIAFESFFYDANDMPPEQVRALKLLLDKDSTNVVIKPAFIKFYRAWTNSGLGIEEFLVKIAEENPSAYQLTQAKLAEARIAAESMKAEGQKLAGEAAEKGRAAADEAAAKGKQMMSAGFGMAKGMMGK